MGIRGADGTTIDSGAGAITIAGLATTSSSGNPHPIELCAGNSGSILITSAKASGDAITVNGTSTSTASDSIPFSVICGSATNGTTVSATGATGNIVVNAVGGVNSTQAMRIYNANFLTSGGNITFDCGSRGFYWGGAANIGALSGSSSTGTFTLRSDSNQPSSAAVNIRMAKVVVEPSGTNFSAAQTFPYQGWAISNATDLRLGKAANSNV
jgi:hypothetical protein